MELADDPAHAFIPGPRHTQAPMGEGALSGLTFAVKDLFDVAGATTTYGNPDWARTHPPAVATAPVVMALLEAGATMAGKTKTVELAFGLTGENLWHGTPLNPRAPDRFPGGSSCGSAASVAAGTVDFALGSDTGGSVRIPASYCGLYGMRPTHGAISLAGACPLAPSLDTPGWFARSADVLVQVGDTLLPGEGMAVPADMRRGVTLLRVEEPWINADPGVAAAMAPALARLAQAFGPALSLQLVPEGIAALHDYFRAVQGQEVWAALGGWIHATRPAFGPGVGERFAAARAMKPGSAAVSRAFRQHFQSRLRPLLAGGAVLIFPTSPCAAPLLRASLEEQDAVRRSTLGVTAIAGLCGLPEITLPAAEIRAPDGSLAPVGLSLVGGHGHDRALLALARDAAHLLGLP